MRIYYQDRLLFIWYRRSSSTLVHLDHSTTSPHLDKLLYFCYHSLGFFLYFLFLYVFVLLNWIELNWIQCSAIALHAFNFQRAINWTGSHFNQLLKSLQTCRVFINFDLALWRSAIWIRSNGNSRVYLSGPLLEAFTCELLPAGAWTTWAIKNDAFLCDEAAWINNRRLGTFFRIS